MRLFLFLLFAIFKYGDCQRQQQPCTATITTTSGASAPTSRICAGQLIFHENFKKLDQRKWKHENTLRGGGNWEFQWYTNNRTNSYVKNEKLYITPTLLADQFGEEFLTTGTLNVERGTPSYRCTDSADGGCERTGTPDKILNPIKSARISTEDSFRFKYGRVEISAKMPAGDWLWPALWMMPAGSVYGTWPASGEIDLMESRGNKNLVNNGVNIGTKQSGTTLHFGPSSNMDKWWLAHWNKQHPRGFDTEFTRYQLEWTQNYLAFSINDVEIGRIAPDDRGFWVLGNFARDAPGVENPWRFGSKMAPFDQEFFIIINLAVGGVGYFPDGAQNGELDPKPWSNNSPTAMKDFYGGKDKWLKTWKGEDASLQVDYVKVWAL